MTQEISDYSILFILMMMMILSFLIEEKIYKNDSDVDKIESG
jgi:hypothetical protein